MRADSVGWAKERSDVPTVYPRAGMVGSLRSVVLSQKVARFDVENQLFEKIQDWRARC